MVEEYSIGKDMHELQVAVGQLQREVAEIKDFLKAKGNPIPQRT